MDRGRLPGELRIRVRWRALATDWFDYWFLSVSELDAVAGSAGWTLVDTDYDDSNDNYLAELTLEPGS